MPLNPDAVGTEGAPSEASWTSKDALLYAVGIGAGTDELPFTTENTANVEQVVFPTFPVVIGWGADSPMRSIGTFNPALLVHGQQAVTLHRPIPVAGTVTLRSKIVAMHDKVKAAVVVTELAMRTCGGAAFGGAHSIERLFRDARAPIVMAPTSDQAYDFIGRALCGLEVF